MARLMHGDETAAFRAVITTKVVYSPEYRSRYNVPESRESTIYAGPFGTKSAATAAITRAKRGAVVGWAATDTVTGYVEMTSQSWVRVE